MWPCYMIELRENNFYKDGEIVFWQDLDPGALWWDDGELVCKIPGGTNGSEWLIDRGRIINEQRRQQGKTERLPQWNWTGEPPNITVSPSINYVGKYHGWLRDGVLTDDCEGRIL